MFLIQRETQRFDKMKLHFKDGTGPHDITGILRYLRFVQDDIYHLASPFLERDLRTIYAITSRTTNVTTIVITR